MSQKTLENGTKPLASKPGAKQSGITHFGEKQDLDRHQEHKKGTIARATTLEPSPPTATVKLTSTPATKPAPPVATLGATSGPPKGELKPAAPQAAQFRKPATATAHKASLALAALQPTPPAQSSPTTAPEKAAAVEQAPTRTVDVRFALSRSDSKQVSLCGEFNGWLPEATPMKQSEGHCWEATLALRPGRYQYKFVVDGQWLHDPNARENLPNPHGSLNSVMEVRI